MSRVRTAVLPVGGLGTRLLPATKAVPKELLPLLDRPCIDYIVAEAVEAGIERIVFVTSRGKDALLDHFDRSPVLEAHLEQTGKLALLERVREATRRASVVSVRQQHARGLGHAVLTSRSVIDGEDFAVLLGDEVIVSARPLIGQLIDQHTTGSCAVALTEVPPEQTRRYGICAGKRLSETAIQITEMVEKPAPEVAPSTDAILGRYVLTPDIFDILAVTPPGHGGEIQLTDALAVLASQGRVTGHLFPCERHDTGNVLGLLRASMFFAARRPDLRQGFLQILDDLKPLL